MSTPAYPSSAATPRPRWLRRVALLLAVIAVLAVLVLAGPRNQFGASTPTARPQPPADLTALDGWLRESEAAYPDIKPGNGKGIVWLHGTPQRTPWAVVYLHGFSASRLETAPVTEQVAQQLGANAFYTRLTGHGRAGAAMGDATPQDWIADVREAVQIGHTLGDRVLVIGCSTGATLATWLATSNDSQGVAAYAFISPNYGPKNKLSELINAPWGQLLALTLEGETRSWTPEDPREAQAWTSSYPTKALFPMMALVKNVRESDLSTFQTPVLMLYSEQDETVDPLETQATFSRIGSPHKLLEPVSYSHSKGQHVLAGAIKDPQAVAPMVESIVKWVKTLPREAN